MPQLVRNFCYLISTFEDRLGLVFAQFPETFNPQNQASLLKFLKIWPQEIPLAIELRHPGWFKEHALLDETVNMFYRNRISTVITDTPGRRDVLHFSLSQPKVLIRFQGNSGHITDSLRLREWEARLKKWSQHALEEIYFFTHQPDDKDIPETAFLALKTFFGENQVSPLPAYDQMELI
jgi:uncharacterized protein YecE (DUF72 family)